MTGSATPTSIRPGRPPPRECKTAAAPAGHAGDPLPAGSGPVAIGPPPVALRRDRPRPAHDRLPAAPARRFLSRGGPLRPRRVGPLHLRRPPRHRTGNPAQAGPPLLGRGLLLTPRRPLPAHREPHLRVPAFRRGDAFGPGGGRRRRLGPGPGPPHPGRHCPSHRHRPGTGNAPPVLHRRRPGPAGLAQPRGGAAAFPGPGVGPGRASPDRAARGHRSLAAGPWRRERHRRTNLLPAVRSHRPVPGPAGFLDGPHHRGLQPGGKRPPRAVRAVRIGGGFRPALLPGGTGDAPGRPT